MYWLYLVIFILIIFVPDYITDGFLFFNEHDVEHTVIAILGGIGIMLFILKERQFMRHTQKNNQVMRKINQISKDLTDSYSYIGEINRKLDILQKVASSLPSSRDSNPKEGKKVYNEILHAGKLLTGTENFVIYFIDAVTYEEKESISINKKNNYPKINKDLFNRINNNTLEASNHLVIKSPNWLNDAFVCMIVDKKRNIDYQDIEIIKALLTQSLFYYSVMVEGEEV